MNANDFYLRVISGLGATTSPHINVADVKATIMYKPEKLEQYRIGSLLASHQSLLLGLQKELIKMARIKTALMQDLLTGKVRVTPLLNNEVQDE